MEKRREVEPNRRLIRRLQHTAVRFREVLYDFNNIITAYMTDTMNLLFFTGSLFDKKAISRLHRPKKCFPDIVCL